MRIVYFEPFAGISGDMLLGALLDLGTKLSDLQEQLNRLPLKGYELTSRKCSRAGIQATKLDVNYDEGEPGTSFDGSAENGSHPHRNLRDIVQVIEGSDLSKWVKEKSTTAFNKLAEAEGKIHGQSPEEVYFHEVGAVDSIVDVVGSMIALEQLLPAVFYSGPVNLGNGTLSCRHGVYPVPGPATEELLKGKPSFSNSVQGELTTPTGATLLTTVVESFGPRPLMNAHATGYGAGRRDTAGSANVLRITVGESIAEGARVAEEEQVAVLEASIDDMNPQIYGYFQQKALAQGALDVFCAPIQMKKNRPAILLTLVCLQDQVDRLARLIFAETTTIGIRYSFAHRKTLQRRLVRVQTDYGVVTVKESSLDGQRMNFVPEFEDCRRLAQERGVALKTIQAAATRAYLHLSSGVDP